MYIYLYENHPDHNLDGENYPHFRNSTDKLIYIKKKLINNFAKPLKVSLTRISFDTARVSLNLTKNNITKHPSTLSGLLHNSKKYNDFEFWFVVG